MNLSTVSQRKKGLSQERNDEVIKTAFTYTREISGNPLKRG